MITATVTITTPAGKAEIAVEVTGAFESSRGTVAIVEALPVNGRAIRPFVQVTHGGPVQTATGHFPAPFLHDLSISAQLPYTPAIVILQEVGA